MANLKTSQENNLPLGNIDGTEIVRISKFVTGQWVNYYVLFSDLQSFILGSNSIPIWRNGNGTPSNSLGVNGDYFLSNDTGAIYQKAAGSYGLISQFLING